MAAPIAAQAVDFTISGQVSRTLFYSDPDFSSDPTKPPKATTEIRDNNGATRVRANGHSVLDDGSTLGIQFEYAMDAGATLRHANVQYTNPAAGRITFGQGSEAGDGSAGLGIGVTGIGAGQDGTSDTEYMDDKGEAISLGGFFGSLDGGGRNNMIRYDTPAIGPLSAAVSIGNGDSVSAQIALSSDIGGTLFDAKVATHQNPSEMADNISASFAMTMPSGFAFGGAWGKGDNHLGAIIAGTAGTPAVAEARVIASDYAGVFVSDISQSTFNSGLDTDEGTFNEELAEIFPPITDPDPNDGVAVDTIPSPTADNVHSHLKMLRENDLEEYRKQLGKYQDLVRSSWCWPHEKDGVQSLDNCYVVPFWLEGDERTTEDVAVPAVPAVPAVDAVEHVTDPSYVRLGIGYTFGNTTVAASWYNSQDFVMEGSEGTALGIGASHKLPKAGATVHASVQNYEVEIEEKNLDETVFQLGVLVTF